ncbi:tRNA threonylcarbamoyl adenosine modification protein YeaZ [Deinobacterium chartae]|uniref:tRNA threonylcarbamoyl adenosine modification protein YeaZ n=1 Tax=Deinobacterium chartae TaxID=521158 RepID=A0A841HWL4_9DEIO|nr:tRNA (adenosine(37)-N6)-threonylcarbamoyltransferase complex dimerization subunit type 1 TsaB [Deinobacterium chartae]MBB6097777.1 tRNA threonylcarbamoyl adenosine modification protein YeaZ [Deinobacterium chartae]
MITLALDTATPWLALALVAPHVTLERTPRVERDHAARIALEVRALFEEAGLEPRADRIALGVGPGSYTGVRVGASYALGLATAWNAPVLGLSTLEAIAAQRDGVMAASLDARKGNVYGGVYRVEEGLVREVLLEEAKYDALEFDRLAAELGARPARDLPPSALALAQMAPERGLSAWALRYL